MITSNKTPFHQAADYLGALKRSLYELPRSVTDNVCEIRLRAGQPLTLESLDSKGKRRLRLNTVVTPAQIAECVLAFCGQSIHSYEKQFREGWLTLEGGHRAGFSGTAVLRDGKVENIRDISSVNLRIAKQYIGCAEELFLQTQKHEQSSDFAGLLIIGKPMSAKTTLLRDLCRLTSISHKVALIDERGEIAATHAGVPTLDVGENTDVLSNFPKGAGIMNALRNLSPEYLFCDEIGWEADEIAALANSGVKTVLTAHSGSVDEAFASSRIHRIIESGGVSHIALLGTNQNIGRIESYGNVRGNRKLGNHSGDCGNRVRCGCGSVLFVPPETPRTVFA
ncbi:MAG: hypothetical protein FWG45_02515 [Oscillospiraceae bacterium]|nr:hypothetical protein [Oscillospiraceae bacterium]